MLLRFLMELYHPAAIALLFMLLVVFKRSLLPLLSCLLGRVNPEHNFPCVCGVPDLNSKDFLPDDGVPKSCHRCFLHPMIQIPCTYHAKMCPETQEHSRIFRSTVLTSHTETHEKASFLFLSRCYYSSCQLHHFSCL